MTKLFTIIHRLRPFLNSPPQDALILGCSVLVSPATDLLQQVNILNFEGTDVYVVVYRRGTDHLIWPEELMRPSVANGRINRPLVVAHLMH